jgi:hypothetical protein
MTYAGVVKSPDLSWLAPLVFYVLYRMDLGDSEGGVIDEDDIYKPPFSDTVVSHLLFHGLALEEEGDLSDRMFITCRAVRNYSDIAMMASGRSAPFLREEERLVDENRVEDWMRYFTGRAHQKEKDGNYTIDPDQYDALAHLCGRASTSMFYSITGRMYEPLTGEKEGGHFMIPRLEVAFPRGGDVAERSAVDSLLSWLAEPRSWDIDSFHTRDRDDDDRNSFFVAVPDVIKEAHRAVTQARDMLDSKMRRRMRRLIERLRDENH